MSDREIPAEGLILPRLLVFSRDVMDDGVVFGSRPIAWGVRGPLGDVATWDVTGKLNMTLRHSLVDAALDLGAVVDPLNPRELMWRGDKLILMPQPGDAPVAGPRSYTGGSDASPAGEGEQAG